VHRAHPFLLFLSKYREYVHKYDISPSHLLGR
jgi:hypothetical protein